MGQAHGLVRKAKHHLVLTDDAAQAQRRDALFLDTE